MQLAADADQLRSVGVPVHRDGHLILANNETTSHPLRGSVPVFYAAQTGSAPSWKPTGWVRRPPPGAIRVGAPA